MKLALENRAVLQNSERSYPNLEAAGGRAVGLIITQRVEHPAVISPAPGKEEVRQILEKEM